jgi:ketosteroid isomerase-like protein
MIFTLILSLLVKFQVHKLKKHIIMKNKSITRVLLSFVILFLMACNTKKAEPEVGVDKEQIKKEIQDKENEFAATYNAGEKKKIGYYADDAISFSQNKAPLVGRDAIVEYLMADIDSSNNSNKISFTTNEVFVSSDGNQVVEIGSYKVIDTSNTDVNTGNYICLFVKRDGKYVCIRDMSASDMPLK